ncbi:MAG: cupin domain-containing protein, partial [Burkholderiaceae bacterium]
MNNAVQPRHFPPGDGRVYQIGRMTLTFKTTVEHSSYTLCEAIEPPRSGAGLHRHPTYDETFIICEGHYEFQLDGKMLSLGPGDVVFVPRGTPHSFMSMGPETGRQL